MHATVKMTIHQLFIVHKLRPFYVFSDVWDSIEAECSIYQNVHSLSGVRTVFWILPQLHILCTSAVKRYCAKNDNSPFKCHLFSCVLEFMEARKTCHRLSRTSVWSIPYSGQLSNKNCVVKTSETLIIWSAYCDTAGSGRWHAIIGMPVPLLKRAALVFRVHNRHIELMLTYWCSESAMIVNFEEIVCNNWTPC